jgi:hypothetical protein
MKTLYCLIVALLLCVSSFAQKTVNDDEGAGSDGGLTISKSILSTPINSGDTVIIFPGSSSAVNFDLLVLELTVGTPYQGTGTDTTFVKCNYLGKRHKLAWIEDKFFTGASAVPVKRNQWHLDGNIDPGSPIWIDFASQYTTGTGTLKAILNYGVPSGNATIGVSQSEMNATISANGNGMTQATYDTIHNITQGEFNILHYMVGPVANASVPLQAAIDAAAGASFLGGGGTVIIPNGAYTFTTQITMKSAVTIVIARNAYCDWDGNANAMFFSNTLLTQFSIYGGVFRSLTKRNTNWVQVESTSDANYAVNNHFEPLQVTGFKHMFETISTGGGFFNENFIGNCVSWGNRAFWRDKPGAGAAGTDGNHIYNVGIQYTSDTKFGIDSLSGQKNIFNNLQFWDFPKTGVPNLSTVLLTSTSNNNYIEGSNVTDVGYQDYGYMNSGLNSGFPIGNTIYLTSTVAKTMYEGYIADGETVGGTIEYTVSATNSDNSQSQGMSGVVSFIVMRNGTTYTKNIQATSPVYGESASMTDMTLTWYIYAGDGVFAVQPTCTAYVTGTLTVKMKYYVKPTDVVIY